MVLFEEHFHRLVVELDQSCFSLPFCFSQVIRVFAIAAFLAAVAEGYYQGQYCQHSRFHGNELIWFALLHGADYPNRKIAASV